MAFENIKNSFEQGIDSLGPVVSNALNQLLQKDADFTKNVIDIENIKQAVEQEAFPSAVLHFVSGPGDNNRQHLFFIEQPFLAQFYAWMIADEPAEELTDDHFEGLKESLQQVMGQVKLAVEDDPSLYEISEPQTGLYEDAGALQEVLTEGEGLMAEIQLSIGGSASAVKYYYWAVNEEQINAAEDLMAAEMNDVVVQPAEFGNIEGMGLDSDSPRNVDMLLDVDLEVTVELDRKVIMVSDLLKLGKGSIVELEKSAGEPLDIFINGRKFAEGEVVVIDDKFGIRITQLLSPRDRLKSLG